MKIDSIYFYAKQILLISVLLVGANAPLQAAVLSDFAWKARVGYGQVVSEVAPKLERVKEWTRERIIPKLKSEWKNFQKTMRAFLLCMKDRTCKPKTKAAVGAAATALVVITAPFVYGYGLLTKEKKRQALVGELELLQNVVQILENLVNYIKSLAYVGDQHKDKLQARLNNAKSRLQTAIWTDDKQMRRRHIDYLLITVPVILGPIFAKISGDHPEIMTDKTMWDLQEKYIEALDSTKAALFK